MMRRREMLLKVDSGVLPSAYLAVDYIEVPDDQNPWIDTGVVPTENTRSQIKFLNKVATGDVIFGFAPPSAQADNRAYRFFNYQQRIYVDYPSYNSSYRLSNSNVRAYINTIYEFEIGNKYVKDLPTDTILLSASSVTFGEVTNSITLGYFYRTGTVSKNRWYYVKIYNGNILIRDMIPCIRIYDNKPGMYDLVGRTFYVNQGTGEFITP